MIIGLVGGVASGKSFVARMLARLTGGLIIDADVLAKQKLLEPAVVEAIAKRFGADVLHPDGQIDRKRVAQIVFGITPEHAINRHWLNELIHPLVHRQVKEMIAQTQSADPNAWIILDVPLLLEAGWRNVCNRIVFVDTSKETREDFARKRGWHDGELKRREESQLSLADKKSQATDIIVNDGSEPELEKTLKKWLKSL